LRNYDVITTLLCYCCDAA